MVMLVCSWTILLKVRVEGRAPETAVTRSARFDEVENVSFVGCVARSTSLVGHVAKYAINSG